MRSRGEVYSWCLYDWANSAFVLTVVSGFFPLFFKGYCCGAGTSVVETTVRLGVGNTVAGVAIALLSLILGAVADAGSGKKRFLLFFAVLGAVSAALLFFAGQGAWMPALLLFILGNIGFSCSNLFYDSLLIDVADGENMDFVSSMGFAFGYIGGVILFTFNVWMMVKPETFGLGGWADAVKVSFLSVAVWWTVFSIPLFLFVKEKTRRVSTRRNFFTAVADTVGTIKKTFLAITRRKELLLFLIAYWLYYDGVNTFIRMAVDFGLSIGFGPESLMAALVTTQLTAFPASLFFGYLSVRAGAGRMIFAGVLMYLLISVAGSLFMRTEAHFVILAALVGLAQGGIQALSRSYFGKLIPPGESTEYFGFYNVVSRFAVAGPAVVGMIAMAARGAGAPESAASRVGMSAVGLFFATGLIFLRMSRKSCERDMTGN
ncbi:MAG: MFS transporter [Chitinispirillales bacterium]|jgi:UMF1 family MFS transporter|nr:MFS transporter [Chitinispirillales bacterium]